MKLEIVTRKSTGSNSSWNSRSSR